MAAAMRGQGAGAGMAEQHNIEMEEKRRQANMENNRAMMQMTMAENRHARELHERKNNNEEIQKQRRDEFKHQQQKDFAEFNLKKEHQDSDLKWSGVFNKQAQEYNNLRNKRLQLDIDELQGAAKLSKQMRQEQEELMNSRNYVFAKMFEMGDGVDSITGKNGQIIRSINPDVLANYKGVNNKASVGIKSAIQFYDENGQKCMMFTYDNGKSDVVNAQGYNSAYAWGDGVRSSNGGRGGARSSGVGRNSGNTMTSEEYGRWTADLKTALDSGSITQEQYNKALSQKQSEYFGIQPKSDSERSNLVGGSISGMTAEQARGVNKMTSAVQSVRSISDVGSKYQVGDVFDYQGKKYRRTEKGAIQLSDDEIAKERAKSGIYGTNKYMTQAEKEEWARKNYAEYDAREKVKEEEEASKNDTYYDTLANNLRKEGKLTDSMSDKEFTDFLKMVDGIKELSEKYRREDALEEKGKPIGEMSDDEFNDFLGMVDRIKELSKKYGREDEFSEKDKVIGEISESDRNSKRKNEVKESKESNNSIDDKQTKSEISPTEKRATKKLTIDAKKIEEPESKRFDPPEIKNYVYNSTSNNSVPMSVSRTTGGLTDKERSLLQGGYRESMNPYTSGYSPEYIQQLNELKEKMLANPDKYSKEELERLKDHFDVSGKFLNIDLMTFKRK